VKADLLLDARAELGEGPVWDPRIGLVWWVDILRGRVNGLDLDGAARPPIEVGEAVGCVALAESGGLVAATTSGFRRVDAATGHPLLAAVDHGADDVRMNDGKADPAGRFVAGSMAFSERPGAGTLWSLDGGRVRALVAGVTISNGLAWSEDGEILYYVDTPTGRIDAFDYDAETGGVSGRRSVVSIPESAGSPDGMTIDSEGGLWIALWGGGAVHRYHEGRLDAVVEVPAPLVTCPAFAGPDGATLVITTASIGLDGPGPESGAVYALRPGVAGRPEPLVRV